MNRTVAVLATMSLLLLASGCTKNPTATAAPTPIVINCDTASQEDWVKYCQSAAPSDTESKIFDGEDGPSAEPSEGGDENFELLPFDGGVFTWSSGIEVTTKIEEVGRWGEESDFCDGCLNLKPDDYRLALRYTVKVPKSYGQSLDVTGCGGTLSVDDGNDDDAFTLVAGDFNKDLSGSMRPGTTKYGVNEWGIKKKYVDRKIAFTYTNSCGDPDFELGEVGLWNGKIPTK